MELRGTMNEPELYAELTTIFRQVLEDEMIELNETTTADDVNGWDSMNHIFIVVALEKRFGVKFHAAEMEQLKNVGELTELLRRKLPN